MWEHGPGDRAGFRPSILGARFWVLTRFWGESGGATRLCQLCTLAQGSHSRSGQRAQTRDPQTRVSPSWAVCRASPDPGPPGPGLTLLGHLQGGQSRKQGVY